MSDNQLTEAQRMNSAQKRPAGDIPAQWRKSRPMNWRLRSLINQRKRNRG